MPIGNTDLLATKNNLVANFVQRELIQRAALMPHIRDVSMFAVKGASSIDVPRAGSFSVENRATTVEATKANVTYAVDNIALDQRATVSWQVDPMDAVESAIDIELDLAGRAARAHAKDFDVKVIAGLEADATATTTAGAISQTIVLEMRRALLEAEADPNNLKLFLGPEAEESMLSIAQFVEADKYGARVIESGILGRIYGIDVVLSTGITGNTYYMLDSDGYGFGIQKGLQMDERKAPELGSGATLKVMDMKYGVDELQNGALILKDNN